MFTPQQIQEQTFQKAVFGGYDMQQVDEFLEPLTEDYITLYKENSVLKAKMKVLVDKLEEYRNQEAQMKKALAQTKAQCDKMMAETKAQCDDIREGAQYAAQSEKVTQAIAQETERMNLAKETARNFIEVIEADIKGHLDLLETLKSRDLTREDVPIEALPDKKVEHQKPYDWQSDQPASSNVQESAEEFASEISENLEKLVGAEPDDAQSAPQVKPLHPESATIKFENLKFGKNYDPTSEE